MASNSKNLAELLNSDVTLTATDIANGAVTTDKLADGAITGGKMGIQLGRRNLIINGAMQVAQRGTSGSISTGNPNYGSVDRFKTEAYDADQFVGTWAQVTDAPTGFSYSGKWTTTTAETAIDASELFDVRHVIEAQNVTHLEYGSSDAKTCTLSFYVKSSVTGTFTVNVYNMDSSRQLVKEYTISSANSWEKKVITVIGDTGGSNFGNDNGPGLQITWNLAAGSAYSGTPVTGSWAAYSGPAWSGANQSNAVGTTLNATWQITGVQLEVGDTATPFEHLTYAEELRACQRYYIQGGGPAYADLLGGQGFNITTTLCSMKTYLPVVMRAQPTFSYTGTPRVQNGQSGFNLSNLTGGFPSGNEGRLNMFNMTGTTSGLTLYQPMNLDANAGGGVVKVDAEF